MSFKDNLRKQRIKVNLSQEDLAEKLSVSRQTISKWENGNTYPSTKHTFKLANILNCDINELIDNKSTIKKLTAKFNVKSSRKNNYFITGIIASLLIIVFCLIITKPNNTELNDNEINYSKIALFDKIINGSLDDAITANGYIKKKILGYGITEENGTFYVKCNLSDNKGNPCSAIIYFCESNGNYSYNCQFLDNPDYIPKGEYYKLI